MKAVYFLLMSLIIAFWGCDSHIEPTVVNRDTIADSRGSENIVADAFKSYWYSGNAEICSYVLSQARYGEMRTGEAVLIFVTEDFSMTEEVKLDDPSLKPGDGESVLKLNFVKKFNTGIYPYSMMMSVFSPVRGGPALKATASSQEWCGHTFAQMNLTGNQYRFQLHSYFESEGEQDTVIRTTWLEDEMWTQIRLDPKKLPQGNILVFPGLLSQRLRHSKSDPIYATATLHDADSTETVHFQSDNQLSVFALEYPAEGRKLSIFFEVAFPHKIVGWEESYADGFGDKKKMLTTRAVLKETIRNDYWKHNTEADTYLRDSLGLMPCR